MSDVKNQENISVESEQELSEILKIRREKLAALQEKGKNPFAITTSCKDTDAADIVDSFDELEQYGKGQLYGSPGSVRKDPGIYEN